MLLGVSIKNFDVFSDSKIGVLIGDDKSLPLKNLSAVIGRNNTGKSSFFNALAFVKDAVTGNVADASTIRGRNGFSNMVIDKTKPSEFKMYFKLRGEHSLYIQYELSIVTTSYGSPVVNSEKILVSDKINEGEYKINEVMNISSSQGVIAGQKTSINDEHLTALGVYGNISSYKEASALYKEISRWYFCRYSSVEPDTYFVDGNAPGGHKHLNSKGNNVLNVLSYMEENDPAHYEKMMDEIIDKIPAMKNTKNLPSKVALSPDRLFLYMLLLRDKDPHSTIFIETPDKDLYHDMVDVLSGEMRKYTIDNKYCQIVFSTHNPYIVENMNPKEIWVFSRPYEDDIEDIKIYCAGADRLVCEMFAQGVGMGAIWYGGHLESDEN